MASPPLPPASLAALQSLTTDLRRIFGNRLYSVCAYGELAGDHGDIHSIALVDRLSFDDLAACVPLARGWDDRGLAVPLILERDEFVRTLDVFPLEYGEIIAHHVAVYGDDPFVTLRVSEADLRRGCELQAKSHLIHLREGFLETAGEPGSVTRLIAMSAAGFRRLLTNLVGLVSANLGADPHDDLAAAAERHLGISSELVREVLGRAGNPSTIADPTALLARYIAAVERLWEFVDTWKRA
jgi:hypothetical protein